MLSAKRVMDKHMSILAKQHIETRFVKIQAEKSPFLAERRKIVVLPTLALINNTKVDDYVVGFNELGGKDDFQNMMIFNEFSRSLGGKVTLQFMESCARGDYGESASPPKHVLRKKVIPLS